ncbi:MAG: DUF3667 domain-containing protein [Ferruginibacter sp.]|nr:DUF3667 domain-containing protein [Cytophagales bacterium]
MISRFRQRKIERKRDTCLNCGLPMANEFNFCPRCGQENVDNRAAIHMLAEEFINTFLAYDSRFFRSVGPFLFRPGFLTNQFLIGRRLSYVHPLRLYLLISLVLFSILSLEVNVDDNDAPTTPKSPRKASALADSIRADVQADLAKEGIRVDLSGSRDSTDSDQAKTTDSTRQRKNPVDGFTNNIDGDEGFNIGNGDKGFNLGKIRQGAQNDQITPDAVLDSLKKEKTYWNRKFAEQSLKIVRRDTESLVEYFLGKTSLMMFLLLPFFALLLKLFYIRSKRFYVEHLVFTLHIHAFTFFLFSVGFLISKVYDDDGLVAWTALGLFVYLVFSFRNVYRQGWFKTLAKMFVLFLLYVTSLSLFLVGTILLSFLLF